MAQLSYRKYGRGHAYYINDVKVDGVTTILNALPKSLTQWAADAGANYAVENWDKLTELPLTKRLDAIRYAHRDLKNTAAARGTEIHRLGQKLVEGLPIDAGPHLGPAEAYARFLDKWDIHPEATEFPLVNLKYRYGGTGDLMAAIGKRDGVRAFIDLKTGNNVYESSALQLCAYNNAELWQPAGADASKDKREASEQEFVPAAETWVAHILPDDVRFSPVRTSDQFRAFLYLQQIHHWLALHGFKGEEPLIGDPMQPGDTYDDF